MSVYNRFLTRKASAACVPFPFFASRPRRGASSTTDHSASQASSRGMGKGKKDRVMNRKQEQMAAKQSERRQEAEEKRGQAKQRRKKAYSRVCLVR